jgi:hypothetical protein
LRGIGQDPDSVLILQQELEHLELKCRVRTFVTLPCNGNKPHPTIKPFRVIYS